MTETPATMPLEQLQEKVGKGITWLVEHDPTGAFHLWFSAGIKPFAMPKSDAQDEERKEAYRQYHVARTYWETLEQLLTKREAKETHGPDVGQ